VRFFIAHFLEDFGMALNRFLGKSIRDSVSPEFVLAGTTLIISLSFTHLKELMAIDDPFKRAFYEVERIVANRPVSACIIVGGTNCTRFPQRTIEANVPKDMDIHLIVDNCGTQQTSQGQSLARGPSPLAHPLHAYL